MAINILFFIFSMTYRFLRLFLGKEKALKIMDKVIFKIAHNKIKKDYSKYSNYPVGTQVRNIYGTVAKIQNAKISENDLDRTVNILVEDCQFAKTLRRFGAEELTPSLCAADRKHWEDRNLLVFKTTRFDPNNSAKTCMISLKND